MFAYQDLVDSGDILGLRAFSTGARVFQDNNFQSVEEVKGCADEVQEYYGTHKHQELRGGQPQSSAVPWCKLRKSWE